MSPRLVDDVGAQRKPLVVETARDAYRRALALAEEPRIRPLAAHCHLGLGKLYGRTGKREHAQEHLLTAMAMFREMGMRFWLEPAEAELRTREEGSA